MPKDKIVRQIVSGLNPFGVKIGQKIRALETYQTPRTAKEFYDSIQETFEFVGIKIAPSLFRSTRYSLLFDAIPLESFGFSLMGSGFALAHYVRCREDGSVFKWIDVQANRADEISGLWKDIFFGRQSPHDYVPTFARIDERVYALDHRRSTPRIGRIGFC